MTVAAQALWGSRTSAPLYSRGLLVLVDQPTKDLGALNRSSGAGWPIRVSGYRRELIKCAMAAVRVVVPRILAQHLAQLPLVEDQHPIQTLSPDRAHPPLGIRLALRRQRRELSNHALERRLS